MGHKAERRAEKKAGAEIANLQGKRGHDQRALAWAENVLHKTHASANQQHGHKKQHTSRSARCKKRKKRKRKEKSRGSHAWGKKGGKG